METNRLAQLLEFATQGDFAAQEELYHDSYRRVYMIAIKMLQDDMQAQDMVQDVFVTAFTKLDNLREPAAWYRWLNLITANQCKNLLVKKRDQLLDDPDDTNLFGEESDTVLLPEAALDSEETSKMILQVIDGLPDAQRLCILYHYYQELTISEIATILECSEGTVKSRLHAARAKIKQELERKNKDEGIRLYGVALPLGAFLAREAGNLPVTSTMLTQGWRSIADGMASGATATTASAAGHTATAIARGLSGKMIAAIVSAVTVTGAIVGYIALRSPDSSPLGTTTSAYSSSAESSALPADVSASTETNLLVGESTEISDAEASGEDIILDPARLAVLSETPHYAQRYGAGISLEKVSLYKGEEIWILIMEYQFENLSVRGYSVFASDAHVSVEQNGEYLSDTIGGNMTDTSLIIQLRQNNISLLNQGERTRVRDAFALQDAENPVTISITQDQGVDALEFTLDIADVAKQLGA